MLDPNCHIEIPADKLREAIKSAYALSVPQGLGFLHARDGGLDDDTADEILAREGEASRIAASMDYVHGRSCKFTVFRAADARLFVRPHWYDHGDHQLEALLSGLGVEDAPQKIATAREAQKAENDKWERENARA